MSYRGKRQSNYATPPKRPPHSGYPRAPRHPQISQKDKQDAKVIFSESEPSQAQDQSEPAFETTE